MNPRPPARAVWMLDRWLPSGERTELIGDLEEEFVEHAARKGASAARRWYWRQTMGLLWNRRRLAGGFVEGSESHSQGLLTDAGADLRHAWRSIRRAPIFSSVALLSLIVSLGMATGVFSIVKAVVLEPLPFSTADRIVRLATVTPSESSGPRLLSVGGAPPPPRLVDVMVGAWLQRRQTLEAIAIYEAFTQTVMLEGAPLRISVADVGPEFFQVLPVQPLAGRTLQASDGVTGAPRVAVVSQRLLAQQRLDATALVGRTLAISDVFHVVAGVLPSDFDWPDQSVDVWVVDRTRWPAAGTQRQVSRNALTLGLMRAGVSIDKVQQEGQQIANELTAAGARLSRQSAAAPTVVAVRLGDELIRPVWPALVLLMAGTFGVLVAANVNLAGFLMSRNTARRRDLAIRQAMGASWWRLIRPLVCEQLLLGAMGAAGALGLAWCVIRVLPLVAPRDLPRLSAVGLDFSSLAFASAAAIVTALAIGLLPARRLASSNLRVIVADGGAALAGSGRRSERTRRFLVVCQVSVATTLIVGAALIGRSLLAMLHIDTGYQAEGVLTFQVGTAQSASRNTPGRLTQFYAALFARLKAQPGVISLGTSSALPLHGDTLRASLQIPGLTPPRVEGVAWPTAHTEYVSDTYFQTLGATLTAGRFFDEQDREGAVKVAIVNEPFVRTFMPGVDPLGQVVPYGVHKLTVVGVIRPIKRAAATVADDPALYQCAAQVPEGITLASSKGMGTAVRMTGNPMMLAPVIRDLVRELDPSAPVYNMLPLDTRIGQTLEQPRFLALALGLFAALALATALLGVYGVLASAVAQRRVELGVRRALGASTNDIRALVFGQALRLAVVGLIVGLIAAAAAASIGRSFLYGTSSADATSYVLAAVAILIMVLIGAWVPMRSALRIDPARVLRAD